MNNKVHTLSHLTGEKAYFVYWEQAYKCRPRLSTLQTIDLNLEIIVDDVQITSPTATIPPTSMPLPPPESGSGSSGSVGLGRSGVAGSAGWAGAAAPGPGPATRVAGEEEEVRVQRAFETLAPDHRRVLGLRQFEGLTAVDAAHAASPPARPR